MVNSQGLVKLRRINIFNLDRIDQIIAERNIPTAWRAVLEDIFNPDCIPSPVLLRPIVDDVISANDIDIIYPDTWLDDFCVYILGLSSKHHLHIFCRADDRRTLSIKLYDDKAHTWIALDIHVTLFQLDSRYRYLTWELIYPGARRHKQVLEPGAIDGAMIYLMHLHVQRKDRASNSVRERTRLFLERLDSAPHPDETIKPFLVEMLSDGKSLLDTEKLDRLKSIIYNHFGPPEDSPAGKFVRQTGKRYRREIGYMLRNSKKIFMVGADGVGKSTLMTGLNPDAKILANLSTYRGNLVYKVAKKISKRKGNGVQAGDILPRFFFRQSLFKTLAYCLMHARKVVFFDRSPPDILVMKRKTDEISLHPTARSMNAFANGLLTIHVIGVDTDRYDDPKSEMTREQVDAYNRFVFTMMGGGRPVNYFVFRNTIPLDQSVDTLRRLLADNHVVVNED